MKHVLIALAALTCTAASAAEAPENPPKVDMSRPVTLTGYEIQAVVKAQAAAAAAQIAAQEAAPAFAKITEAVTVKD